MCAVFACRSPCLSLCSHRSTPSRLHPCSSLTTQPPRRRRPQGGAWAAARLPLRPLQQAPQFPGLRLLQLLLLGPQRLPGPLLGPVQRPLLQLLRQRLRIWAIAAAALT